MQLGQFFSILSFIFLCFWVPLFAFNFLRLNNSNPARSNGFLIISNEKNAVLRDCGTLRQSGDQSKKFYFSIPI